MRRMQQEISQYKRYKELHDDEHLLREKEKAKIRDLKNFLFGLGITATSIGIISSCLVVYLQYTDNKDD